MGEDKLSLTVGEETMVERVRAVLAPICSEIVVVGDAGQIPEFKMRRVEDLRSGREGPLAGMEAGLSAARFPIVFIAAGDMPFVSRTLGGHLLERTLRGAVAAIPWYAGKAHPLCAAYRRDLLVDVSVALDAGERAVWRFLERVKGVEYVQKGLTRFGDPEVFLMSVNTPDDLQIARRLALLGDRSQTSCI